MWFLDLFIDKLKDCSVNIFVMFKEFIGYRNIKNNIKKFYRYVIVLRIYDLIKVSLYSLFIL